MPRPAVFGDDGTYSSIGCAPKSYGRIVLLRLWRPTALDDVRTSLTSSIRRLFDGHRSGFGQDAKLLRKSGRRSRASILESDVSFVSAKSNAGLMFGALQDSSLIGGKRSASSIDIEV